MSHLLTFTTNIAHQPVHISDEQINHALKTTNPDINPKQLQRINIDIPHFPGEAPASHWEDLAFQLRQHLPQRLAAERIEHLHIFAIGPMPLLMLLGQIIGDKLPASLYQAHRDIQHPEQNWTWRSEALLSEFQIQTHYENPSTQEVGLVLSLSDTITPNRYKSCLPESASWYEITLSEPIPTFLQHPDQLMTFSQTLRQLFNQIQATHPGGCCIHLFPAVPVSIAVQIGRMLLPTKDPAVWVHEFGAERQVFRRVLQVL